jgi:ClpP class serine protease
MDSKLTTLNALVGNWHIDFDWGLSKFGEYVANTELFKVSNKDIFEKMFEKSSQKFVINSDGYGATQEITTINTKNSILELRYEEVMRNSDGLCSIGINTLVNNMYEAYANPNISGVLLHLNSGGGESSSGYNLQSALLDKNKPVVVSTYFLGSAAVNGALGASEIIATNDAAQVGSIGSYYAVDAQMLKYLRDNVMYFYSKVSPDKNKDFRELLDKGDATELIAAVTENAKMFQKAVTKYRPLNETKKEETLSGGMFYAKDAKSRGLIDAIGTRDFAIKRIQSLIKYNK